MEGLIIGINMDNGLNHNVIIKFNNCSCRYIFVNEKAHLVRNKKCILTLNEGIYNIKLNLHNKNFFMVMLISLLVIVCDIISSGSSDSKNFQNFFEEKLLSFDMIITSSGLITINKDTSITPCDNITIKNTNVCSKINTKNLKIFRMMISIPIFLSLFIFSVFLGYNSLKKISHGELSALLTLICSLIIFVIPFYVKNKME